MQQVELGDTGQLISRLGLGTWAIGGANWVWGWGHQDEHDSIASVRRAVEHGVTWIDTAASYGLGEGERVIGRALAALPPAERPLVFTKGGSIWDPTGETSQRVGDPALIRAQCEESLIRLGVERIDLYQLHWPSKDGIPVEDTWATMHELVNEGKVRWVGICNHDRGLLERCVSVGPVTALQQPLSLIEDELALSLLPWCVANRTALLAYSPMYSGLLSGRFSLERAARLGNTDWRRRDPNFNDPMLKHHLATIERLRPIVAELGCSVGELAIAWTLNNGADAAIVGARDPEQVDGWIGAADIQLDDGRLRQIRLAMTETRPTTEHAVLEQRASEQPMPGRQ
jgi:aryl-alcohol dehydrogenase-like predicted oxidoreductase